MSALHLTASTRDWRVPVALLQQREQSGLKCSVKKTSKWSKKQGALKRSAPLITKEQPFAGAHHDALHHLTAITFELLTARA